MIEYENTILSGTLFEEEFVCNLGKCKGACCVMGDAGAPLTQDEVDILDEDLDKILPFLPEKGRKTLEENGVFTMDAKGEYETTLVEGKECAFTVFREDGTASCGIEDAYNAGKTEFLKPISCHLYPVRTAKLSDGKTALNYHTWNICSDACTLGKELKVPVYKFVESALVRAFGKAYVDGLESVNKVWKDYNKG